MRDVNLLISDSFEQQGATMRKFQIEMQLDPAADVASSATPAKTATAAVALDPEAAAGPTTAPAAAPTATAGADAAGAAVK